MHVPGFPKLWSMMKKSGVIRKTEICLEGHFSVNHGKLLKFMGPNPVVKVTIRDSKSQAKEQPFSHLFAKSDIIRRKEGRGLLNWRNNAEEEGI